MKVALKKLVEIKSGYSPSTFELMENGSIPYVKVEDMNNCTKYQSESREYCEDVDRSVPSGAIIFPKRGAAIMNNKVRITATDICMDTNMMAIIPNGKIQSEFLYYTITHEKLSRIADTSTIPQINNKHINPYKVALPPLPEQQAIADLLSTWDKAIEKTERLIQAKELRFRWLLRELISDQYVEQNQGSEWKLCRLGKFIVERNEKSTAHDQHPVLTSSRKGLFYQSDYFSKQVTSSDNEGYKIVNKGDFTYRAMSDDGKFTFNRLDFCNHGIISPAYGVFYPKNINSDFLLFYMNSSAFFREVLKESQGGTRISLKLNAMKKILVSIPSIELQNQIAETLSTAQREIDLLKQLADKYKIQKRGLMQRLLTGEWRIKPDVVKTFEECHE